MADDRKYWERLLEKAWYRVVSGVKCIKEADDPAFHPEWTAQERKNFADNVELFAYLDATEVDKALKHINRLQAKELCSDIQYWAEQLQAKQKELSRLFFDESTGSAFPYHSERDSADGTAIRDCLALRIEKSRW